MKNIIGVCMIVAAAGVCAQTPPAAEPPTVVAESRRRLEAATEELAALRAAIVEEKLPLAREASRLETEHVAVRQEYDGIRRKLDNRALEINNLKQELRRLEQEQSYLSNLFAEYARNFETRLHIAELRRFENIVTAAKSAHEQYDLPPARRFVRQLSLVEAGLRRLNDAFGGMQFEGRAASEDGLVVPGRFAMIGPIAFFAADAAPLAGVAEQRLGSLEPTVSAFADPEHTARVREFVAAGEGVIPFDATLGSARKIEQTRETLGQHIRKGGPVMVPILTLAALVFLLAFAKFLALTFVRMPSSARTIPLFDAIRRGDAAAARSVAAALPGPAGRMLAVGADHLGGSKDLIEEAMYERMLETRFRFNRGLPFIAVGAACAPLLGLLGTVTGIISTFKLITVFGSGDVKMLSAGISEALITTEFGLIIAIPSLLAHAFLSRKARALLDRMEQLAVAFLGALAGAPTAGAEAAVPPPVVTAAPEAATP